MIKTEKTAKAELGLYAIPDTSYSEGYHLNVSTDAIDMSSQGWLLIRKINVEYAVQEGFDVVAGLQGVLELKKKNIQAEAGRATATCDAMLGQLLKIQHIPAEREEQHEPEAEDVEIEEQKEQKIQPYYFTFGSGSAHKSRYVEITGRTYTEARNTMNACYGPKWAFQYTKEKFEHLAEEYGLTKLSTIPLDDDIPF